MLLLLVPVFAVDCEQTYSINPNESAFGHGQDCYNLVLDSSLFVDGLEKELIVYSDLKGTIAELWLDGSKLCTIEPEMDCKVKALPETYTIKTLNSSEYEFTTKIKSIPLIINKEQVIEPEPVQAFEPDENAVASWTKKTDEEGNTIITLFNGNGDVLGVVEGDLDLEDVATWQGVEELFLTDSDLFFVSKEGFIETESSENLGLVNSIDFNSSNIVLTEVPISLIAPQGFIPYYPEDERCDEDSLIKLQQFVSDLEKYYGKEGGELSSEGENISSALIETVRPQDNCAKTKGAEGMCSTTLVGDYHSRGQQVGFDCFEEASKIASNASTCMECNAKVQDLSQRVYYLAYPEERILEPLDTALLGLAGLGILLGVVSCGPQSIGAGCAVLATSGSVLLAENVGDIGIASIRINKSLERDATPNLFGNGLIIAFSLADMPSGAKFSKEVTENIFQLGLKYGVTDSTLKVFIKNLEKKSVGEFAELIVKRKLGEESFLKLVKLANDLPAKELQEIFETMAKNNAEDVIAVANKHGLKALKLSDSGVSLKALLEVSEDSLTQAIEAATKNSNLNNQAVFALAEVFENVVNKDFSGAIVKIVTEGNQVWDKKAIEHLTDIVVKSNPNFDLVRYIKDFKNKPWIVSVIRKTGTNYAKREGLEKLLIRVSHYGSEVEDVMQDFIVNGKLISDKDILLKNGDVVEVKAGIHLHYKVTKDTEEFVNETKKFEEIAKHQTANGKAFKIESFHEFNEDFLEFFETLKLKGYSVSWEDFN